MVNLNKKIYSCFVDFAKNGYDYFMHIDLIADSGNITARNGVNNEYMECSYFDGCNIKSLNVIPRPSMCGIPIDYSMKAKAVWDKWRQS